VLEGAAARLAAERLSGHDESTPPRVTAAGWRRCLDSPPIRSRRHRSKRGLPLRIVDLAKSTALRRQVEQVYALPFAAPSVMICPTLVLPNPDTALAIASDQHRAIVEGNREASVQRAEHLMREHAYGAGRVLESSLSNADALSRIPAVTHGD